MKTKGKAEKSEGTRLPTNGAKAGLITISWNCSPPAFGNNRHAHTDKLSNTGSKLKNCLKACENRNAPQINRNGRFSQNDTHEYEHRIEPDGL
jgi:hypothetical protein